MQDTPPEKTIRDLVNTPFKKAMFGVQILSYILIPGSPFIGGFIGRALDLKTGHTAGLILGIFIAGEILFYGSLFNIREIIKTHLSITVTCYMFWIIEGDLLL
jgi:hypothetical protein